MVLSGNEEGGYFTDREEQFGRQAVDERGIGWKFANQGMSFPLRSYRINIQVCVGINLLERAVQESSIIAQDSRYGDAMFARMNYINAIAYLLRGLPSDLTTDERLNIRSALPDGVCDNSGGRPSCDAPPVEPSLLHRTLATTIIQLFLILQLVLPYFKYLLTSAYQYDREHKISERVLAQGIETGRRGVDVAGGILAMGDGKVGKYAAWVVEGVMGGIYEGLGEGMAIVGARKDVGLEIDMSG